jgi:hypothetical protein
VRFRPDTTFRGIALRRRRLLFACWPLALALACAACRLIFVAVFAVHGGDACQHPPGIIARGFLCRIYVVSLLFCQRECLIVGVELGASVGNKLLELGERQAVAQIERRINRFQTIGAQIGAVENS